MKHKKMESRFLGDHTFQKMGKGEDMGVLQFCLDAIRG